MDALSLPEINSVGAPPVRHADRIVASWLRHLAERNATLWNVVQEITKDPYCRDGSPKAQRRLESKVKAAGATHTILETGKRGRYRLLAFSWTGWDPVRDAPITIDDDVPDKPWIASYSYEVLGMGHGRMRFGTYTALMISHHALSRCVQRWRITTFPQIEKVVEVIGTVGLNAITNLEAKDKHRWHVTPDCGLRIPFPGSGKSVMILKGHVTRQALVVATILGNVFRTRV
jgi:hypothetical protein